MGKPKKKNPNNKKYLVVALFCAVLAAGGFYMVEQKLNENVEISLSEAVQLSKLQTFSEMKVGISSIKLIVVDDVANQPTTDISGKGIQLSGKQEVIVNVGSMNLKDLKDIGLVIPPKYSQDSFDSFQWSQILQGLIIVAVVFGAFIYISCSDILAGSSSKQFKKETNSITFADIGGIRDVKESLVEAAGFLKDRDILDALGAKIPRGILLTGQPGVGKTMLAKAIATEANVPFYYTTGSEFHTMWAGMAGQRIKKLFKQAKKSPSIVFIDEFDSIAQSRSFGGSDVSREFDHTLNQLLAEMDGFDTNSRILVIAATNHPEVLDPAVLRPGRFDRKIRVPLPTYKERCEILEIHKRGKPLSRNVKIETIAKQTSGLSGADLAAILNEASIIASGERKNKIAMNHIHSALDRVLAGSERKGIVLDANDKRLLAYHEAGHAIVATILPHCDKVQRISILPRSDAGGFTRLSSDKEELVLSRSKAIDSIAMLFGGRAAEEVVLGDISSGASDDIKRANMLATEMVEHYGMSENFGLRYCGKNSVGVKEVSSATSHIIDIDIKSIIDDSYKIAVGIVQKNRVALDRIADRLIESESLNCDELNILISKKGINEKN